MKKILLIVFVLLSFGSKAQVNMGIGPVFPASGSYAHYDTVTSGTVDTVGVWVKNYGTSSFTGWITLDVRLDTAGTLDSVHATIEYTFVSGFNPGDSTLLGYYTNYNVAGGIYRYGIDVIVVWPVALDDTMQYAPYDSLRFPVFIEAPEGIKELDIQHILKLYPNPGTDLITIEDPQNSKAVETVIIYDQGGKAVLTERRKNTIDIQNLPPGMYHAEVYLSDKKHYSIKFIKRKN